MKKAWVQAAIDVDDIDVGKKMADLAVRTGAEWIEVGTPLLFKYGFDAIRSLKETVRDRAKLVADYKFFYAPCMVAQAAEAGADYVIMEDNYQDDLVRMALELAEKNHVQIIYSLLTKKPDDYAERGMELVDMGVKYLFMWSKIPYRNRIYDTLGALRPLTDVSIGVSNDNLAKAVDAVREGADWITFGKALVGQDLSEYKRWIDGIHNPDTFTA